MKEVVITRNYAIPLDVLVTRFMMDDNFRTDYHRSLEHSDILIRPWDAQRERKVDFKTPFDAPEVVKKMLGLGKSATTNVVQKQSYHANDNEHVIKIDTILSGVPLAESFAMTATMTGKKTASGSELSLICRCEFTGKLPGAKGKIEKQMESDSVFSWGRYFDMIEERLPSVATHAQSVPTPSSEKTGSHDDRVVPTSAGSNVATPAKPSMDMSKETNQHTQSDATHKTAIETPNTNVAKMSHVTPSHSTPSHAAGLYSDEIAQSFRIAVNESDKEKNMLLGRVKELEERSYSMHMKHQTLLNVIKTLSEQDFLQELSLAMHQLGATDDRLQFAEQRCEKATEQRDILENEYQEMYAHYTHRYNELSKKIHDLETENVAIQKTMETLVATNFLSDSSRGNHKSSSKSPPKSSKRRFFGSRRKKTQEDDDTQSVKDSIHTEAEFPETASVTQSEAKSTRRRSLFRRRKDSDT